jgi:hypothetical protein
MAERGLKKRAAKKASAEKAAPKLKPKPEPAEPESARVDLRLPIMLHKRVRLFSLIEGKTIQESVTELIETGLNVWDDRHHECGGGGAPS